MKKNVLLELSPDELKQFVRGLGEPDYRAAQVLEWIYKKAALSFAEMTNLPKGLRDRLESAAAVGGLEAVDRQVSGDGTEKLLLAVPDGNTVETVILPYEIGHSACISTQVGCKMGCRFCASGLPGFIRSLSAAEIMAQVLHVKQSLHVRGEELKGLVLMGAGEPLDNFDATVEFLKAARDPERLGMSLRHITLSTAGLVPGIRKLAAFGWPLTLAVSLHAPNNALRDRIMPINKKYPLDVLLPACDDYARATGRRITYEYIMIAAVNDGPEQARELAGLLRGKLCHVNLIPLNAVPELGLNPSPEPVVAKFRDILRERRIQVTVRRKMGADIAAACGQLRNQSLGASRFVRGEQGGSRRDYRQRKNQR